MSRPGQRVILLAALLAASSLSCGREITGPGADGRRSGPFSFAPEFPAALRAAGQDRATLVAFDRVRVVFRRSDGAVVLDKGFQFGAADSTIDANLSVPVSSSAPESGEVLSLSLYYIDAADDTVFTGGPVPVTVRPFKQGDPPPQPISVTLRYTGPGEEAVRVVLSPAAASIVSGQTQTFTTQAFDQFSTPVTAPVLFESTDTTVVTVSAAGVATAKDRRASASIIARLYGGEADTSLVSVTLPAARIALASGNAQTGPAGTVLAQNVVVLVTAADSVPVAGVAVTFAASNGGAPGAAAVMTDAAGFASTTWSLGNAVGTQTMTASVTGLTGSPVSFTATVTPAVPSSLVFTTQPTAVVAGAAITPAVVVEARTTGGSLAVGYTDSVRIAIGANPATGTLAGVRTVAAVNGIATFPGLTLDRAGAGYTLVATSGALTSATSAAFAVTAGAAAALEFSVQPVGGSPGLPLTPSPVVSAVDAFGNPAAFVGNVTVSIGANPGGATLGGTTTRGAVANVSTFNDLTLSVGGAGYTLVAAATGLTSATSDPFDIGTATISWSNPAGGSWGVAGNWNLGRVPDATDVVDISLAGTYTVSLSGTANLAGLQLGHGAGGTQTLQVTSGSTLNVAGDIDIGALGVLRLSGAAVNGGGALLNSGIVALSGASIGIPVDNSGTLTVSGNSFLNATPANRPTGVIRVAQADGCCSTASLTVATGFANQGTIELSNAFTSAFSAQLTLASGTLVNTAGATIVSLGGTTPGGARTIAAQLTNAGTLAVEVPLSINSTNAAHQNSGLIVVNGGDLAVVQSGGGASFTNTGSISIAGTRTLSVSGGTLALAAGSVAGPGTLSLAGLAANLTTPFSTAATALSVTGSTISGTGTLTNDAGRTLALYSSTITAPLVNEGTLIATGTTTIGGSFTNALGATTRVAQLDGCCSTATLTVATGFVNAGAIELSNQTAAGPFAAQLTVTAGTLVNAAGATIAALGGQTPGGARILAAQLDNQGTVSLAVPLQLNRASSAHVNSGTIDATLADLSIVQTGGGASFTNTGTITLATGRTLSVSGGAFGLASGSLGGAGTLVLSNLAAAFSTPFTNAVTALAVSGSTLNGSASLTNAAGRTLSLYSSTINAPFVNDGLLIATGSSAIGGALTQSAGATMRVAQLDGCCSTATLSVANGFTNLGAIELSNQTVSAFSAQLVVSAGTLVNAPGATIASLGGQTPGGGRVLAAQLDNQGTLSVQVPLAIDRASSAHVNSGTIDASAADLSILQTGGGATFTNTGTMTVGTGRTLLVQGGSFAQNAGTLGGTGAITLQGMTAAFATPFTNATTQLNIAGSTINGTAVVTNAAGRTLALSGSTINAPFVNDGLLITSGSNLIGGAFTNAPGATTRVAQLDGCCSTATLTVSNGFTNQGTIELSNQFTIAYGADLFVTSGTLVNAPGATIAAIGGQTPGGGRSLNAQLDNQGTVLVDVPLAINRAGSAHVNSGLIDLVGGNLTVIQSGGGATFTNTGATTVGAGRTFTVNGGTYTTSAGATVAGAGGLSFVNATSAFADVTPPVASIALSGGSATFAQAISNASTTWSIAGTTIDAAAGFTNATGQTLVANGATLNAPVVNQGTFVSSGSTAITGAFSNLPGATLRVAQVDGCCSTATLTIASGFTNQGSIEISNQTTVAYAAQLNVTSGTLVNASGATIAALGGQTPGGARGLGAMINNQGTLLVATPLTLSASSADHLNSGLIDLTAANLTLTQTGTTPTFTNSGAITLGAGRLFSVSGGAFTDDGVGTIDGGGAGNVTMSGVVANMNGAPPSVAGFSLTGSTLNLSQAWSTATAAIALTNSTVNGSQPLTNAAGRTMILDASTIATPFVNAGTVWVSGSAQVNGGGSTTTSSVIRIGQINGATSLAQLSFANAFTNNGQIELTTAFAVAYNARLAVSTGQFVNSATGTIISSDGLAAGGTREITAPGGIDNQGTITVGPGTAGRLTITGPFQTSGTIDVELGGGTQATQYDHLQIVGSATLGGTLNVAFINAFTPAPLQSFTPITYSSLAGGTFGALNLPGLLGGLPTYGGTGVSLLALP